MSHYYLYVECKTNGCPGHINVMHFEAPDMPYFTIDYPHEDLALGLYCPLCRNTHSYEPMDQRTKSSAEALHPLGWKPILPFPHPNTQGKH